MTGCSFPSPQALSPGVIDKGSRTSKVYLSLTISSFFPDNLLTYEPHYLPTIRYDTTRHDTTLYFTLHHLLLLVGCWNITLVTVYLRVLREWMILSLLQLSRRFSPFPRILLQRPHRGRVVRWPLHPRPLL